MKQPSGRIVLKGKTFSHSPRGRQNHLSPHCQSGNAPCRRPQSPAENSGNPMPKRWGVATGFPGYAIHIWKGKLPSRERIHIPPWEKENYRLGRDMLVPRRVLFLEIHPGGLTWNIIMEVWKIIFLSKWVVFSSMLIFQGVIPFLHWTVTMRGRV